MTVAGIIACLSQSVRGYWREHFAVEDVFLYRVFTAVEPTPANVKTFIKDFRPEYQPAKLTKRYLENLYAENVESRNSCCATARDSRCISILSFTTR